MRYSLVSLGIFQNLLSWHIKTELLWPIWTSIPKSFPTAHMCSTCFLKWERERERQGQDEWKVILQFLYRKRKMDFFSCWLKYCSLPDWTSFVLAVSLCFGLLYSTDCTKLLCILASSYMIFPDILFYPHLPFQALKSCVFLFPVISNSMQTPNV